MKLRSIREKALSGVSTGTRVEEGVTAARLVGELSKLPRSEQVAALHQINRQFDAGYAEGKSAAADLSPGQQLGEALKEAARHVAGSKEGKQAFAAALEEYDRKRTADLAREAAGLEESLQTVRRQRGALEDMKEWASHAWSLERPHGSIGQRLVASFRKRNVIVLTDDPPKDEFWLLLDGHHHSFLIEHDWKGAFKHATDFVGGEYRLPFERCIFEMKLAQRRLCAAMTEMDGKTNCLLFIETRVGWALHGSFDRTPTDTHWRMVGYGIGDEIMPLMDYVGAQIGALCIALDTELVETETTRVPFAGKNTSPAPLPQFSYHVVSLTKRSGHSSTSVHATERHPRLHFVRGHWRHYETFKSWIKWHLRGDADLGFVDKHYRL